MNAFSFFFKPAKSLTGLFVLSGFVILSSVALAHFEDIPSSSPTLKYINYLNDRQIITGYPDNTFKPYKPVTRAEFAVMLAKSQKLPTKAGKRIFRDVSPKNWAAPAIQAVTQAGWIKGFPGRKFMPNRRISLAEVYVVVSKVAQTEALNPESAEAVLSSYRDASQLPAWARIPAALIVQKGLIIEEAPADSLWPSVNANRSNVATVLAKLLNPDFLVAKKPAEMVPQTELKTTLAKASVVSQSTSPQSVAIPKDASSEPAKKSTGASPELPATAAPTVIAAPPSAAVSQPEISRTNQTAQKIPQSAQASVPSVNESASPVGTPQSVYLMLKSDSNHLRPVRSVHSVSQHPIGLYFSNEDQDPLMMLGNPSIRYFRGSDLPQQAVEALLQGPTEAEHQHGYFIDKEICQLSLVNFQQTQDGQVSVVLEAPQNFSFKSPLSLQRLEAQLQLTLQQFPGFRKADIAILDANHAVLWTSP